VIEQDVLDEVVEQVGEDVGEDVADEWYAGEGVAVDTLTDEELDELEALAAADDADEILGGGHA
jgi:hypothetical protein